jgi:phosphoenolpyruvate carboxylase
MLRYKGCFFVIDDQLYSKLKKDVNFFGDLLGQIIKEQAGDKVFNLVESIRKLAKITLEGNADAQQQLLLLLDNLEPKFFIPVTKAFSQFLNFANIAEEYHRIRQTRFDAMQQAKLAEGSFDSLILQMRAAGIADKKTYAALLKINIEFVFTAHPTEVKRRTIMSKYQKIHNYLKKLDQVMLTEAEKNELIEMIKSEMTSVWLTPEIREQKPTAIDEAKWGFATIESSVWDAVPQLMRELDIFCLKNFSQELPLDFMPVKFDTWMGGDRDGNPFVTADITIKACQMASWVAANLISKELAELIHSLSMVECSNKLRKLVGDAGRPYNFLLKTVHKKLQNTLEALSSVIQGSHVNIEQSELYHDKHEILVVLIACYDSLVETNAKVIARSKLLDLIRQVNCFGLALMRIDIRQDARKHVELMDLICQTLSLPNYSSLDEQSKQEFLIKQIKSDKRLLTEQILNDEGFSETLNTIRALTKVPRDSLGNYVISMSSQASDVLLIVFLQKQFDIKQLLPVVPLFEMGDDLLNAANILECLLGIKSYRNLINDYQQIMIGYSDSAKDIGVVGAAWLQYTAQENLSKVAQKHKVNLVFFHGRGGSVGRGGWPTHRAILSQPPKSINNCMRITQQGEVIKNRFGLPEIAVKTMTVHLSAILEATLVSPPEPDKSWRTIMNKLAALSTESYQQLIYHNKDFINYFLTCTPINELDKMAIGSRPSRRNTGDLTSIRNIRAIPWTFAWTQNRLLLSSWLGMGSILEYAIANKQLDSLRSMEQQWPFFRSILAMTDIVLAKADPQISLYYERRLSTPELHTLGNYLRAEFENTKELLLQVKKQDTILSDDQWLQGSINVRNKYILPLHLIQAELLYRTRHDNIDAKKLAIIQQALLICTAGISAGMRNTG